MRRWKQAMGVIVSFALVAAMLLPMSALAREQAIPTIRLTLGNGQTTPQYAAGETSELLIRVWNKGTQDAGNVKISPVLDDGASWPFEIADMNNELELGTIPAGQYAEAVWKDLKVRDDVETKSYKLAFTVTYDDGENQFQSTPYIFAKTTAKPEEKPDDNNNTTDDSTFTKILNQVLDFITKYQIYIISALTVILIILVILIISSKKKKRGVLE